jgi:hypothetical protein
MDLEDFIRTALVDIAAGVALARDAVGEHGGVVGSMAAYGATTQAAIITDGDGRLMTTVEFDVALAETKGTDTKGGIGVFLGSVGLGTQGASHGEATSHSRIRFSVPMVLPGPPS